MLDRRQPSAIDHPLRAELVKAEDGFQPAAIGFHRYGGRWSRFRPHRSISALDGLKRIELRWGFQDAALLSSLRVVAPAPRRGVLALLDQPTFGIDSLPPLPANVTGLFVMSIDLAKSYDQVDALMKLVGSARDNGSHEPGILAHHGMDLRKDLLGHLGPRLAFYTQVRSREEPANRGRVDARESPASRLRRKFATKPPWPGRSIL